MNDMAKNIVLWVIIAVVLMTVFNSFTAPKTGAPAISYSSSWSRSIARTSPA